MMFPKSDLVILTRNVVNLREWPRIKKNIVYVYHYTSVSFAADILSSMRIEPSRGRIPQFGTGVFVTSMSPSHSTTDLLNNNYRGNSRYLQKTQCAFALPKRNFTVVRLDELTRSGRLERSVGRIDSPVDLNNTDFYLVIRE